MSFVPVNPRPMLQELVNKTILVRLKWGETEYKGTLVAVDSYMNLQLSVLIRCNNVLWVRGAGEGEQNDATMSG
ncbi:hypothetical protein V2G26_006295 [Clonostachys chloroleuca]